MKIKPYIYLIIVGIFIVSIVIYSKNTPGQYDDFAKCVSESGAKFYGAYWCPHCNDQKKDFGNSFEFIDYIECSLPNRAGQTQICIDKEIKGYPTWEFGNGERVSGRLSFDIISQKTGCSL